MSYLKKTHPIAQRRQKKKGKYHLTANNGVLLKEYTLPIGYILRDILRLSRNLKETKKYLMNNSVIMGGKIIREIRHPVSFLETIQVEGKFYKIRVYKKKKSSIFPVREKEIFSPIISKTRLSPISYQLNTLSGRNYKISSEIVSSIPIGSTIIERGNTPPFAVLLEEESQIFLLSGKNMGNIMVYKTMKNNQYLTAPLFEDSKLIPYNERVFFPITGTIVNLI